MGMDLHLRVELEAPRSQRQAANESSLQTDVGQTAGGHDNQARRRHVGVARATCQV